MLPGTLPKIFYKLSNYETFTRDKARLVPQFPVFTSIVAMSANVASTTTVHLADSQVSHQLRNTVCPISERHSPFLGGINCSQVNDFAKDFIRRRIGCFCFAYLLELSVVSRNNIGVIDRSSPRGYYSGMLPSIMGLTGYVHSNNQSLFRDLQNLFILAILHFGTSVVRFIH
jgi:hypothetical protein